MMTSGHIAFPGDDAVVRREIEAVERRLYDAQVASDVAAIAPLLSADLRYLHSTGVGESKAEYLAGVEGRLYEYGRIQSRGVALEVAPRLAIQHGVVDMTVSAHGAPKSLIHLLFCLVWRYEAGQWRLLYRQATRIPDPA
jgi:hypothetical protein